MLLRDVFGGAHPPLSKDLILAVAPIYNADGNERVSKDQSARPGRPRRRNGPAGQCPWARPESRLHQARGARRPGDWCSF